MEDLRTIPANQEESDAIALLARMADIAGDLLGKPVAIPSKPSAGSDRAAPTGVWKPDLRYRSLVEKLPVVTFMASLDEALQELYVSPQIETLLGFTQQEWLENPIIWFSQLHPDDRERWVEEFARTCATGEHFRAEYRLFAKDGHIVWVQGECQLIRDDDGRPLFLQGIAFDITHLKNAVLVEEAKRAAEAASVAKSEFLARMSHEIRTPLNGVVGMIDLLRATGMNDTQQRYAQLARESADALMLVINDILDFSKIEAGKVEIEAVEFDLGQVAEDLTELLSPMAAKKGLALACFLRPDVPRRLIGDPNRIRQVLTNLVGNALKFTKEGYVAIRIALDHFEGSRPLLRVQVEDTGIGIPPDRLDRLFKSFSQVDSSTTRKFGGTGLGLVISKRLVELMGGEIGIKSEEGKGTIFWFTLNLGAAAAQESVPDLSLADALREVRVLAIEPDATYRRILTEQLDGRLSASSQIVDAPEAIDVMRRANSEGNPFAVVLVPYGTPDWPAIKTAGNSPAVSRPAKFVAIVDIDNQAETPVIIEAGFAARLHRPLTQSRLLDTIARATVERPAAADVTSENQHATPEALKGLHLLVAEDNEMNQFVTQQTLDRVGCTCAIVSDGALAVEAVRREQYDAILMDCQMPGMDGLEASRRIREWERSAGASRRIPIIALTAEAIQGDREKCLAAGMDGYVTKPINAPQLFDAIGSLVQAERARVPAAPAPAPPVSKSEIAAPPIDVDALVGRCMGDVDFACKTLEKFQHRALGDIERLRGELPHGDAAGLKRLSHNLMAVAAHVGAGPMRKMAFEIEQAFARQDFLYVEQHLQELDEEARRCAGFIPVAVTRLTGSKSLAGSNKGQG